MRLLVSEKGYEQLRVRGAYRYAHADAPTIAMENWRLTGTPFGEQILRIDLDGRPGSGNTTLYHAILTADWLPVRVTYRRLTADGGRVAGNILAADGVLINRREVDGQRFEEEVPQLPLLLPSVTGLAWLWRQTAATHGPLMFATFDTSDDEPAGHMRLLTLKGGWHNEPARARTVAVGPTPHETTAVALRWGQQERIIWCDAATGWPLMLARGDGLHAHATHIMVN